MKNWFYPEKLCQFFLKLFLLSFPLQIQTMLYKSELFSGQFNYFGSIFLNLSEVFMLFSLLFFAVGKLTGRIKGKFFDLKPNYVETLMFAGLTGILLMNLLSVFWATDRTMALLVGLKWLELFALLYMIVNEVVSREIIIKYLFIGATFQVLIGLGQYLRQGDLGLSFLGEPRLGADYLNIAKIELGGESLLRAYGTFSHANLFGGYLFVCFALLVQTIHRANLMKNLHYLFLFLLGLLISFSRAAWMAIAIFLIIGLLQKAFKINWKKLVLAAALILFVLVVFSLDQVILARILNFSVQSFDERLVFSQIATDMISRNPWLGVGAGNFVLNMGQYHVAVLSPWLLQPVHDFFMMVLAELGIFGLLFWVITLIIGVKMVFSSMRRLVQNQKYSGKIFLALLMGMLILSLLDHYFYTLWAGQVMLVLVISLIFLDYRRYRLDLIK